MANRVKQFWAAVNAKVTAADRAFVAVHLSPDEAGLFYGMNLPDQRHALNVAYTALSLAGGQPDSNHGFLVRCALLHDVGKVRGDVSTWDKIITVLAHRLAPAWAAGWGRPGRGGRLANLRHAFYTYFHHPERSAALVIAAGTDARIAAIIRRHHESSEAGEPVELTLLRRADELN